jgi:ribosome modulation factor
MVPARSEAAATRSPHRCRWQGAAQRARWGRGWDEELILGVGGSGTLLARDGDDGNLWGGGIRRRRLVPVDELPRARRNKPHHTAGVAWDLLTEEERHWVGLLPSAVENRGVSAQRSPRKTGEGVVSVGIDGWRKAMEARTGQHAYPLAMTEVASRTEEAPRGGATTARWFYLTNGDWHDDVWWPGGRRHPTGGPSGGVNQWQAGPQPVISKRKINSKNQIPLWENSYGW